MPDHNLDNLAKKAQYGAAEAIRTANPTFLQFTDVIVLDDETTNEEDAWYADATWNERTSDSDAPDSETLESAKSSSEPVPYQNLLELSFDKAEKNPEILVDYGAQLGQNWLDELDDDWWTALLSADSAVHPQNGGHVYAAYGGGTAYFADDFNMTTPAGTTWRQKNFFSDAISDTALTAALAARHNYLTPSGRRAVRPGEKPILFAVSSIAHKARNLLGRQGEIYDGSTLQLGQFGNAIADVVVVPGGITDSTTAWGLLWPSVVRRMRRGMMETLKAAPLMPVVRNNLQVRVERATSDNAYYVIGHGSKSMHYRPWEGDFQLHKS